MKTGGVSLPFSFSRSAKLHGEGPGEPASTTPRLAGFRMVAARLRAGKLSGRHRSVTGFGIETYVESGLWFTPNTDGIDRSASGPATQVAGAKNRKMKVRVLGRCVARGAYESQGIAGQDRDAFDQQRMVRIEMRVEVDVTTSRICCVN